MAAGRRKKRQQARRLKFLIGILAVILVAILALAASLSRETPPDPTIESTEPTTQTPTTEPTQTDAPTQPPFTGWMEEEGTIRYYENGVLCTGLYPVEGVQYCFGSDGALVTDGWFDLDGKRYYANDKGNPHIGWLEQGENRYYLQADGTIAQGRVQIDGQAWFFTETGCQFYLVNPWNYVPEGYEPILKDLPAAYGDNQKVEESCYDALLKMMDDCKRAGHKVYVVSSYRTQQKQESLYNRQVQKQMDLYGYSLEEAKIVAATISAIPGTSEHQLGLAVDIVDTTLWDLVQEQEDLPGQQWLMEHCHEYGFVLRYPANATDSTGIIYEPWHYRYVGVELATRLHELGITVEEYINGLS